jgi:hypothetical protein
LSLRLVFSFFFWAALPELVEPSAGSSLKPTSPVGAGGAYNAASSTYIIEIQR